MFRFVCAESDEHVKKVNPTPEDVQNMLNGLKALNVSVSLTAEQLERATSSDISINERHDFLHMLMDDIVTSAEQGNQELNDGIWLSIVAEIKEKQKECRGL